MALLEYVSLQWVYYLPIVVALRIVAAVIMPIEEIASSQPLLPPLRLLQLDSGKPAEMKKNMRSSKKESPYPGK